MPRSHRSGRRRGGQTGAMFRRTDHPGASRHPSSARRGMPYTHASPVITKTQHAFRSAFHAFDRKHQANRTEKRTAGVQDNHRGAPNGTIVIPEIEVEAVQAVVDPTLEALAASETPHRLTHSRFSVNPGRIGITELYAQNGKWRAPLVRTVIGVVFGKELRFQNRNIRICLPESIH